MKPNTGTALPPEKRQLVREAYDRLGSIGAVHRETGITRRAISRYVRQEGNVREIPDLVSEILRERSAGIAELPREEPKADLTALVRQAVETELERLRCKGETGKAEVIVESAADAKPGLLIHAPKPYRRVAFLSDFHFPFQNQPAIDAALEFLGDWNPDLIILGGDQVDCYRISDYDSDPGRTITLQDELDSIAPFWKAVDAFSSADVVVFEGNHEHRLSRLVAHNPGLYNLRSLAFPVAAELPKRFQWYRSQTHYKVGSLVFLHGDLRGRGNSVKHAAAGMLDKLRTSCVFGHYHRTGQHYETGYDGTVRAGFAVGHMSDAEKAAEYIRSPSWQSGFATVEFDHDAGIFQFVNHLIVRGRFNYGGKTYGV